MNVKYDAILGKLRESDDAGISSISDSHIFATEQLRDAYFTTNPTEKVTGVFISVGEGYQQWSGTAWVDKTAVVKGEKGDSGAKGDKGDNGDKGDKGDKGDPGTATSTEILQGTKSEIKRPDSSKKYLNRKPVISFVSDDGLTNIADWLTVFQQSFGSENTPKGCLALVSDWHTDEKVPVSASLTDSTTISFNAVTQEITDSEENFLDPSIDPPFEVNSVINIQGSASNNTYFVIKEISAGAIKVYTNPAAAGWGEPMVTEVNPGTREISIYRGNAGCVTWDELQAFVDAEWEIQSHSRTHRCMAGTRGGYDVPTDTELWTEVFDSKRILEEKLGVEVTNFVYPFGNNNQRARQFIHQAGYKTARSYSDNGPAFDKFINYGILQPYNLESPDDGWSIVTLANALAGTCSTTANSTTVVGNGTDFTVFADGDLIVLWDEGNSYSFVRRVVGTPTETSMTVDKIFSSTLSLSDFKIFDPTLEVFDTAAQTGIALVNNAVINSAWLIWTGHAAPTLSGYNKWNTVFEYGQYLSIDFLSVEEALQYYDTVINIGGGVSISQDGFALQNAESEILTLSSLKPIKIGYRAGVKSTDRNSVFIGNNTGAGNNALNNVFIGYQAGISNTNGSNVFIGYQSGTKGSLTGCTAIGLSAGNNSTSTSPVFVGQYAGQNATGTTPTAVGTFAGKNNTGAAVTLLGYQAGEKTSLGATTRLVAIGYRAGRNSTGSGNVFLGYEAGQDFTENGCFLVENRNLTAANPLIKGYFSSRVIILGAPATATSDASMGANSVSFYLDEGNNKLMFKIKYADGTTIKTGELALT